MKKVKDLLKNLEVLYVRGEETALGGISDDSREVKPGFAFVACRGGNVDGHRFISEAIKAGATAIFAEEKIDLPEDVALVVLPDTKKALPELARAHFGAPEEKLTLIGVTGTNGKTSVTFFIHQLLGLLGQPSGLIGTIFYDTGIRKEKASHTTPGPIKLRRLLREMLDAGLSHVVMEVSSHALAQGRVAGLSFDVAAFTNLSRDHLDYHRDMEAYFQAKKKLFTTHLKASGQAVVNVASTWGRRLAQELSAPVIKIGEDLGGMVTQRSRAGYSFLLVYGQKQQSLATTLYGDFQLENLLMATGCGLALGFSFEEIVPLLPKLKAPPGRLELIGEKNGALIFVDYAHTPEALKGALMSLRPVAKRLLVLFGCGGDRDQGKRPLMGQIAEAHADQVILTSDNPRSEDPQKIINDILKGMKSKPVLVEPDRREAIWAALSLLREGDILLIAGKGHEDYQEIAGKRYPFSDAQLVREFLTREAA